MNFKLGILSTLLSLAVFSSTAFAQEISPFNGCSLKNQTASTNESRSIWKPVASHFSKAVMVVSKHFYPNEVDVRMYTPAGVFIEKAKTKSSGIACANPRHPKHHECLYAAVVIWKKSGAYYQRKYGEVWVRVKNARNKGKGCRYYQFPEASKKYNVKG